MTGHRVIADGIETFGVLTPWSEIQAVVLAREPAVSVDDLTVAESYLQIVVEFVNGDFLEIPEGNPSWDAVVDGLSMHRPLLVADLPGLIAAGDVAALESMTPRAADLAQRIRARGLPESVARLATLGGEAVHPVLSYRVESVSPSPDGPAWNIVSTSGREDLVPLWECGTVAVFSAEDGSFLQWSAEEDEPWTHWPDFAGVVRDLLTDLWEDDAADEDRTEVARLLLPEGDIAAVLIPEER